MAPFLLESGFIYGIQNHIRNNIVHLNSTTIAYPAGVFIVVYDVIKQTQKCIPIPEGYDLVCLKISADYRSLAVSYKTNGSITSKPDAALILMYDTATLRKIRQYTATEGVTEVISLSFTPDNRFLIGCAAAPNNIVFVWYADKMLQFTLFRYEAEDFEARNISCSPFEKENIIVCISGRNLYRVFRIAKAEAKLIYQMKNERNVIAHSWAGPSRIVACTDESKLILIDCCDVVLELSFINDTEVGRKQPQVTNLRAFTYGILATMASGNVVLFDKFDDDLVFKKSKEFFLQSSPVSSIALAPDGDHVVCSMKNGMLYTFLLGLDQPKGEETKVEVVPVTVHGSRINNMDGCQGKSVFITSSADKTIQIWAYPERKLELKTSFEEEVKSVSIHPSGGFLVAAFEHKVCLMAIFIDGVKAFWEMNGMKPKICKFSHGGQYFALVIDSGIIIYNTWTTRVVHHFKGQETYIKSIQWSANDLKLVTCGTEGLVIIWNLVSKRKEAVISAPSGILIRDVQFAADARSVYFACSDMTLKQMVDKQIDKEIQTGTKIQKILVSSSGKLLFAATENGCIRVFPLPLDPKCQDAVQEFRCHQAEIKNLYLSDNDEYLFSSDADGCIFSFKVQNNAVKSSYAGRGKEVYVMDEVLVHVTDLQKMQVTINDYNRKIVAINKDWDNMMQTKELANAKAFKEIITSGKAEIAAAEAENEKIRTAITENQNAQVIKMERLASDQKLLVKEITDSFHLSLDEEARKTERLNKNTEEAQRRFEDYKASAEETHFKQTVDLQSIYTQKLQTMDQAILEMKAEHKQTKLYHINELAEVDSETEKEVINISTHFESLLAQQKVVRSEMEKEYRSLKGLQETLVKESNDSKTHLEMIMNDDKKLQTSIKTLHRALDETKKELVFRNETLEDKELRIHDLRKKNQELETFKTILELKISGLKELVRPEEEKILALGQQLFEMNKELASFHENWDILEREYLDMINRYKSSLHCGLFEMWRMDLLQDKLATIAADLKVVGPGSLDHHELKREFIAFFNKHRSPEDEELPAVFPPEVEDKIQIDVKKIVRGPYIPLHQFAKEFHLFGKNEKQDEHRRKMSSLEKVMKTIKGHLSNEVKVQLAESRRMLKEQAILVDQFNEFKHRQILAREQDGQKQNQPRVDSDKLKKKTRGEATAIEEDPLVAFLTDEAKSVQEAFQNAVSKGRKRSTAHQPMLPPVVEKI